MVYFDNFGIMKKIGNKTAWLSTFLLTLASLFTACSSDDVAEQGGGRPAQGMAKVTLRIATDNADGGKASTRAWEDINVKTYPDRTEMMYSWIVLITDGNAIKYKISGSPSDAKAEIDDVCTDKEMASGTYTVYSFANISEESLQTILGLDDSPLEANTALTDEAVTAATATINGNGFVPSATNGIPMSNKQTLIVPASGSVSKDLIVVRMLAKITLSVKNETGAAVTIKKITLSDVTKNADDNLKLLPKLTSGADNMEAVHKDIQPTLNGTPATVSFSPTLTSGGEAIPNDETKDITFYVNESATPTNSDHLFNLTLELNNAEYRYSIINQNGKTSDDDGAWDYIARNDYRVLPIVLDDYKFQIIPYDFPAIGVYPASVKAINESENLYEMTFHDYGHFHLLPTVTKGSGTGVTIVPYASTVGTSTCWTLNTDWAGTWSTYDVKDGTLQTTGNYSLFYREGTATADADDAGGIPVWYVNDGVAGPKWRPDVTKDYQPFIFGYIADPGKALAADKKIYHEMKIKLYVDGVYRRDMIYRFYMTLSKDQMSYSRGDVTPGGSRGLGVERPRMPHNHIWK